MFVIKMTENGKYVNKLASYRLINKRQHNRKVSQCMKTQFIEKEIGEDAQSQWESGKCNEFMNINMQEKPKNTQSVSGCLRAQGPRGG